MAAVLVTGVDRPRLAALLATRGLTTVGVAAAARLALVPCPSLAPALPSIVQADDPEWAAALLDAGAADVVLVGDTDALVAARLAALARRPATRWLRIGDICVDTIERQVTRAGRTVALLPREYALLLLLARAGGRTVPGEVLRRGLSGLACSPETNVVAVHLSRLRARLGPGRAAILTERGCGYRLVADADGVGPAGSAPGQPSVPAPLPRRRIGL